MTASTAVLEHPAQRQATPGRLVVDHLPMLARHTGSPPDLVLRWNTVPPGARVDVVLHLHGFSGRARGMHLVRDKLPVSGLDLGARRAPALGVLPRGHFYGGRHGNGFSFPALRRRGAVLALADEALRRFNAVTGAGATRGRLILTAHSGGGAALMHILTECDPDEVHTFDALYTDPAPLIAWARRKLAAGGHGALRVIFRAGEGTAENSLAVARAVPRSARFRVERTPVEHNDIPGTFGGPLLADPAADLPRLSPALARRPGPQHELTAPAPSGPRAATLSERIARTAQGEFRRWRPGGAAALTETSAGAAPLLRQYYRNGVGMTVTDAQLRDPTWQAGHPWSAVFVSHVMRTAGAGSHFAYSPAHQTYIRAARRNRLGRVAGNPFWAYRVTEIAPRVGDLVCTARSGSGATYDNIADPQTRPTHCDVVIQVQPGRIRVVGGNVGQTVGEKWLTTLPDGRLSTAGRQSTYFAVISSSGARRTAGTPGAGSGPAPAPAPAPTPTPTTRDARAVRVMEILVQRYRYPVSGAAGLVGNLMAESGVIPERIEGSAESTPMRARGFDGRVRTFTPEEIRDRDRARGRGPQLPGVGLAQWTSANRRAGLFTHTFNGRRPGAAILSDLPAQVDYLVTELGRDYPRVDAVLRRPGVTVDQASDEVLVNFERPATVVNTRPGDPARQAAVVARRTLGQRALTAYRRAHP